MKGTPVQGYSLLMGKEQNFILFIHFVFFFYRDDRKLAFGVDSRLETGNSV